MRPAKLNKAMILHALKLCESGNQASELLGVNNSIFYRACKRLGIDYKAILGHKTESVKIITTAPIKRTEKPIQRTSTASEYSGRHLGDYSR